MAEGAEGCVNVVPGGATVVDGAGVVGIVMGAGDVIGAAVAGAVGVVDGAPPATGVGNCIRWAIADDTVNAQIRAIRPWAIRAVFTTMPLILELSGTQANGRIDKKTPNRGAFNTKGTAPGQERLRNSSPQRGIHWQGAYSRKLLWPKRFQPRCTIWRIPPGRCVCVIFPSRSAGPYGKLSYW